jgi:hypothetical protein
MRHFLMLALGLCCSLAFAQAQSGTCLRNPDRYVFHHTKDTLYLTAAALGQFTFTDSIRIFDTIQIDGAGAKEVVFARHMHGATNDHGGMFDIVDHKEIKKYEIWNMDTKTLLFEAIAFYKNDFDNFYAYQGSWGALRQGKGSVTYQYDFAVDENGQVTISNVQHSEDCLPDHPAGVYPLRVSEQK